jgi:hypothetical protein
VRSASPNPLAHQRSFAVEPMHFEHVVVSGLGEAEYLLERNPEQAASWQADKAAMNARFQQSLADQARGLAVAPAAASAADRWVVRTICRFIEPGFWRGPNYYRETVVRIGVQVIGPDGEVVDEIGTGTHVWVSSFSSSGGRLRDAAKTLGKIVARYLRERTSG